MFNIVYFSPTGNTKYLAQRLHNQLGHSTLLNLDNLRKNEITIHDHLILMYPIHGFNPPRTVKRWIKKLNMDSIKEVSLIAVGCNKVWVNDAVSIDLRRLFEKNKIRAL